MLRNKSKPFTSYLDFVAAPCRRPPYLSANIRHLFFLFLFLSHTLICGAVQSQETTSADFIKIDYNAPGRPFPHIWEDMFGSGRSVLSLQENYRDDLRKLKSVADVKYIRFHDIFHDDVGIYNEDKDGNPIYNFTRADQIYDG